MADKFSIGEQVRAIKGPNAGVCGKISAFKGLGRVEVTSPNRVTRVFHYSWLVRDPVVEKFAVDAYLVANVTDGNFPRKAHATYEAAFAEACRLSLKQRQSRFVVLHVVDSISEGCC